MFKNYEQGERMGWSVGFDSNWNRWIGYGIPAYCDHPDCNKTIDRGLAYVCCHQEPYGGDGCGLYFCAEHSDYDGKCERCQKRKRPFKSKPEHPTWIKHILKDKSWKQWRDENPDFLKKYNRKTAIPKSKNHSKVL